MRGIKIVPEEAPDELDIDLPSRSIFHQATGDLPPYYVDICIEEEQRCEDYCLSSQQVFRNYFFLGDLIRT